MNIFFKTNYEIIMRRCDRSIKKAMIIYVDIHQTNEKFSVMVQPKMYVKWNLRIICGYHFLIDLSLTL